MFISTNTLAAMSPNSKVAMPPLRTSTARQSRSQLFINRVTSIETLSIFQSSLAPILSDLRVFDVSEALKVGRWCAGGGYADVCEGTLEPGPDGEELLKVAIKRFRVVMNADEGTARVRESDLLKLWLIDKFDYRKF